MNLFCFSFYIHLSFCVRRALTHTPLQALALNSSIPVTLAKVVLAIFSASVTTVTDDWNNNFLVLLVVGENSFETVTQVVEVLILRNLGLENSRLDRAGAGEGLGTAASEHILSALAIPHIEERSTA